MSVWGPLVHQLKLRPQLRRVGAGDARVGFHGPWAQAWLAVSFGPEGDVRVVVSREEDQVLMSGEAWRMVPRSQVPGYPGGLRTGDPDFDGVALVLSADRAPLALLDEVARRRVARFLARGGRCYPDRVVPGAAALAAVTDAEGARGLIEQAAKVLQSLAAPSREALLDRALGEPLAAVRAAARAALGGRITAEEILPRLPAEDSQAVVEQLLELRPQSTGGVALWVERLAKLQDPRATHALIQVLAQRGQSWPTAGYEQLRARLAADWRAGVSPDPALLPLLARQRRVVTAVCGAARDAGTPQAAEWLAALPAPSNHATRLEVADGLLALGHPKADAAVLALEPSDRGEAQSTLSRLARVPRARAAARVAHLALQWPALFEEREPLALLVAALADALGQSPQPGWVDRLAAELPPHIGRRVMDGLVAQAPRRAAPWLLGLRAPDPQAAQVLAEALGELGDVRAESKLLAWLDHDVEVVRRAAIDALGRCGSLGAVGPLERFTGFFSGGELKTAATAAIAAIRARGAVSPVGGLSDASGQGGGLSEAD